MIATTPVLQDSMPLQVVDIDRVISESAGGARVLRLTGIFQRADNVNTNGRVYPKQILEHAVKQLQPQIQARAVMGEFDHPKDAKIHMDRVSHLLSRLWVEGSAVYGQIEVLENMPCGNMLKALIEADVQVSVSSRGVGDMKTTNIREGSSSREAYEVLPGYSFVTFDAVAEPSVVGTALTVMESIQRELDDQKKSKENAILEAFKSDFFI